MADKERLSWIWCLSSRVIWKDRSRRWPYATKSTRSVDFYFFEGWKCVSKNIQIPSTVKKSHHKYQEFFVLNRFYCDLCSSISCKLFNVKGEIFDLFIFMKRNQQKDLSKPWLVNFFFISLVIFKRMLLNFHFYYLAKKMTARNFFKCSKTADQKSFLSILLFSA